MIQVEVSEMPFDASAAMDKLGQLRGGALASFTGIARDDGGVIAIELEHYPAMTDSSLNSLVNQAVSRWALLGCVLIHRVGRVKVGEPIVFVGTASSHRTEALEACAYLIDRLKTEAPFWKKEHHSDGASHWVDAKSSDHKRAEQWI